MRKNGPIGPDVSVKTAGPRNRNHHKKAQQKSTPMSNVVQFLPSAQRL